MGLIKGSKKDLRGNAPTFRTRTLTRGKITILAAGVGPWDDLNFVKNILYRKKYHLVNEAYFKELN